MVERFRNWLRQSAAGVAPPCRLVARPEPPAPYARYERTFWGIRSSYDRVIVLAALALTILGFVAFYSAVQPQLAGSLRHAPKYLLELYAANIAIAACVALLICRFSFERISSWASAAHFLAVALTFLAIGSPFAASVRGRAVVALWHFRIDPAPLLVVGTLFLLAVQVGTSADLKRALGPWSVGIWVFPIVVLLSLPRLSFAMVLFLLGLTVFVLAGNFRVAAFSGAAVLIAAGTFVASSPYRLQRVLFLFDLFDLRDDPLAAGWWSGNPVAAIVRGQVFGVGYGEGLA